MCMRIIFSDHLGRSNFNVQGITEFEKECKNENLI